MPQRISDPIHDLSKPLIEEQKVKVEKLYVEIKHKLKEFQENDRESGGVNSMFACVTHTSKQPTPEILLDTLSPNPTQVLRKLKERGVTASEIEFQVNRDQMNFSKLHLYVKGGPLTSTQVDEILKGGK